jgi:hypothetical protein
VKVKELRGWSEAVQRARQLWPQIPAWAFELAAEQEAELRTYEQAEWFSLHPSTAADLAVRTRARRERR